LSYLLHVTTSRPFERNGEGERDLKKKREESVDKHINTHAHTHTHTLV